MKSVSDDGKLAAPYSEIAATIQRLKDKGRKYDETERLLQRILQFSEIAAKREMLMDANAVTVVAGHLRTNDCASVQQNAATILLNLSQCDRGRHGMISCGSWDCVSYRHACPLFYLLQLTVNTTDILVKRISAAAVVNCSFHAACQAHIEDVGGINLLLKMLKLNDEGMSSCVVSSTSTL
ncbi:Aste57867_11573 [Aphanomyces stellatus]|uniref:Aste57867_11573 protein n=1 Tax=Aphanomyces stellatus TaxID=120398 RepID=A0A485KTD3_9STRA|nr:hypothetical protein As57867_011530 [Aphanomyces stellatus]VFT88432.1 Aste57867_11573 [Aphanomyces stellatus]